MKSQNVILTPIQYFKRLSQGHEEFGRIFRENMFELGGHWDHLPASLAHMLYCIVAEEQYNLAYFFVKRIDLLSISLIQTRRPRSDRGKARHSVLSTSAHHNRGSSSHQGYDDEDNGASVLTIGTNNDEAGSSRSKRSRHETVKEFDKVCADDELQTKKIIKFRLDGRAHSLTLLEFARRLGLYQAAELEEDGFNVYFEGGLRNDDNFNAQDYWLSISRGDNIGLSRSHTSTIRKLILRVIHKMITYGLCQRTTGALTEDVVRSLSALIYCRNLDTTTLRDLIDSDGKLIPEDPQPGVPRVGIPRPPRASMQDNLPSMNTLDFR
ncbi:hypothetical protein Tco_1229441 [Tanacetum coccineum]